MKLSNAKRPLPWPLSRMILKLSLSYPGMQLLSAMGREEIRSVCKDMRNLF